MRWALVGLFPYYLVVQVAAQCLHAFSFGLFHVLAMRILMLEFAPEQQGRAQALYSTMWGLGVASGSLVAGHYWQEYGGSMMFYAASCICCIALFFVSKLSVVKTQTSIDL